jgi:hypothetical protein
MIMKMTRAEIEKINREEARRDKIREKVYYRLYKFTDYGWAFPVNCEDNLKRWLSPELFERLTTCDDRTFETLAIPLARLQEKDEVGLYHPRQPAQGPSGYKDGGEE